jgi:hypothetical protein
LITFYIIIKQPQVNPLFHPANQKNITFHFSLFTLVICHFDFPFFLTFGSQISETVSMSDHQTGIMHETNERRHPANNEQLIYGSSRIGLWDQE